MIRDALSDPAAGFLLAMLARSSAVIASAGLVVMLMRRRSSASARHFVWVSTLAATLALPALSLSVPGWGLSVPGLGREAQPVGPPIRIADWDVPPRETPTTLVEEAAVGPVMPGEHATPASPDRWALPRVSGVAVAWGVGCLVVLSSSLVGRLTLRRMARRAVAAQGWEAVYRESSLSLKLGRRVVLLKDRRATMPMTWGCLRPVVLLPADSADWPDGRRRTVLLHELAHVKRIDGLTHDLVRLACAVFWFNPLVWLAAQRTRVEREIACDDLVLETGVRPSDYARDLLEVARGLTLPRGVGMAAVAMARASQLESRVRAVLDPGPRRRARLSIPLAAGVSFGLLALAVPISTVQLRAQGPKALEPGAKVPVSGRVLDLDGKAVANASVDVIGRARVPWIQSREERERFDLLGSGSTDVDGSFKLDATSMSADRYFEVHAIARGTGLGMGWVQLNADSPRPSGEIRLAPETVVPIRVVDETGAGVEGVELQIRSLGRLDQLGGFDVIRADGALSPRLLRTWPTPIRTDASGRAVVRGISTVLQASFWRKDDRFMGLYSTVRISDPHPDGEGLKITLERTTYLDGRVVDGETGRPVPGAFVKLTGYDNLMNGTTTSNGRTDADGRYRVSLARLKHLQALVLPPAGSAYYPKRLV